MGSGVVGKRHGFVIRSPAWLDWWGRKVGTYLFLALILLSEQPFNTHKMNKLFLPLQKILECRDEEIFTPMLQILASRDPWGPTAFIQKHYFMVLHVHKWSKKNSFFFFPLSSQPGLQAVLEPFIKFGEVCNAPSKKHSWVLEQGAGGTWEFVH
jgi:hypothetical protein